MVFRIISSIALLVLILFLIYIGLKRKDFWKILFTVWKSLLPTSASQGEAKKSLLDRWRNSVYLLVLICTLILAASGFAQPILAGHSPSGGLLLIHVTIAPVFAVAAALLILLLARSHASFPEIKKQLESKNPGDSIKPNSQNLPILLVQKFCFWSGAFLSLPVILTPIFSMFPYFSTRTQHLLLQIHGYTTLLLLVVIFIHSFSVLNRKMK